MSRKKQKVKKKYAAFNRRCGFLGISADTTVRRQEQYHLILGSLTWPAYLTQTKKWDAWEKYQKGLIEKAKEKDRKSEVKKAA